MLSPMKDPDLNQTVLPPTTETVSWKPIQRWSVARKRDVVLRLLRVNQSRPCRASWRWNRTGWSSSASVLHSTPGSRTEPRMTRSRPGWVPPTSAWANSAWRTNYCARRSPAWRAACLFTGRGRADERGDLACHLPELRRAARLPHLGSSALVVLPCHPSRRGGTPRGTLWPGAAGGGGPFADRHNCSRPIDTRRGRRSVASL